MDICCQNQNCYFLRSTTLKLGTSDPMLVKPKLVWEVAVFCGKKLIFKNLKKIKSSSKSMEIFVPWAGFEPGTLGLPV